jgi:type I restriction enzyme S subunit
MSNNRQELLNNGVAVGPQSEGRDGPSNFPAYPAYKDSGVEWLGEVPESWTVTLLKRGYEVVLGKMLQPEAKRDDDEFLPYLRAANIQVSGVDISDVKKMWFGVDEKKSLLLRRGDLLVSEGGDVGRSAIWDFDEEFYFQNSINRIRSIAGNNTRFLYFWMITIKNNGYVDVLCNKSTIAHFTAEKVAAVPLPIPSIHEQIQIARFLDHETARIDALIEEQQRLIELLKEKRQAVISHAVTKGLDPTVPMKDSGVEWLGEVPAHWDVTRSKFVFRLVGGYAFKSEFFQKYGDGEKVLITPGSFDEVGRLYFSEKSAVQYSGEWQSQFELEVGDLVMVMTDLSYKKLILGRAAFVRRDDALLNQRIAKVVIAPRVKVNYLWLSINSEVIREQVKLTASGATVFHTSPEKVGDCWMALPPCEEQLQIAAFAEEFHLELDSLIEQVRSTVGLLRERRSALISAAVTGKIDVRGWPPPADAGSASTRGVG